MPVNTEIMLMIISVVVALIAFVYAYVKYVKGGSLPVADTEERRH